MTRHSKPEITERDLRLRTQEILDSVERGQAFTITRDGYPIGELAPLPRRRTFVPREEFLASAHQNAVDPDRFRDDLDAAVDSVASDPYPR